MTLPRKGRWLLAGLLGTLLLVLVGSNALRQNGDAESLTSTVEPAIKPKKDRTQVADLDLSKTVLDELGRRPQAEGKSVDIFKGKSWYVPPPPPPPKPVVKAPPPKPTAPPIPYTYLGSYMGDGGKLIVFLTRNDRVYSVALGDVLDGTYRVEEIASGQLVLDYLPMNIRQTMRIGEAS